MSTASTLLITLRAREGDRLRKLEQVQASEAVQRTQLHVNKRAPAAMQLL